MGKGVWRQDSATEGCANVRGHTHPRGQSCYPLFRLHPGGREQDGGTGAQLYRHVPPTHEAAPPAGTPTRGEDLDNNNKLMPPLTPPQRGEHCRDVTLWRLFLSEYSEDSEHGRNTLRPYKSKTYLLNSLLLNSSLHFSINIVLFNSIFIYICTANNH